MWVRAVHNASQATRPAGEFNVQISFSLKSCKLNLLVEDLLCASVYTAPNPASQHHLESRHFH